MHIHRQILSLILLAAMVVFACKKKANTQVPINNIPTPVSKDPIDTIIGNYIVRYGNNIYTDTIFVMKKTSNSFCFLTNDKKGPPGSVGQYELACFNANDSNFYPIHNSYGSYLLFYPEKDSAVFHYRTIYYSSGGVSNEYIHDYCGKK